MARALVIDVLGDKGVYEADINELDDYYEHLRCDCMDCARRRVGSEGKAFDLWVDDEGLLRDFNIVSAINKAGNPMLVGNIVILDHDGQGGAKSLTDDDIEYLKRYIYEATMTRKGGKPERIVREILTYVEY